MVAFSNSGSSIERWLRAVRQQPFAPPSMIVERDAVRLAPPIIAVCPGAPSLSKAVQ
jgi:hypothetical protein